MIRKRYTFAPYILTGVFVISIFTLFFLVSITYRQIQSRNESEELVLHSKNVHIELEQLVSYVKDAETGQRGFLLTRDSIFLQPYFGALDKANDNINSLKNLVSDNKEQLQNLDTLSDLVNKRFIRLEKVLKENPETLSFNSLKVNLRIGKNIMDKIRHLTDKMIDIEIQLLHKRELEHAYDIKLSPILFLLTAFFSLLVFIGAFYIINRDIKGLKKVNNQLLLTHETFEHAEEIANISNWCWNIEANILSYSNNQYRLLGCEPHEFEPTVEKFNEFVHPDDRHIIEEGSKNVLTQSKPSIAFFRVIRKDGAVRYFKSMGKMMTDNYGKKILIGINADITEQYLKDKILEEKLFDLERSNNELSAFNHVASHDLQEPLRKIQTFISRIIEKDFSILPEKTKEYFSRIQIAAGRMQKLIDDLLLYSRANKVDTVVEPTDLNVVLENSKQEFAQIIEEKNAIIQSSELPTLNVIPFQIQQLFNNLIGNSLKYSKPIIAPVITIKSKIVLGKEIPNTLVDAEKKFYKITIADNGIGFEQEYADKIFTLFHRLHQDQQYSGTGIGLTICKKIVENHKGFINAQGIPNAGSVFSIFLPA